MVFPPKTLAIDFGTKRVGLALSFAGLAEPFKVLANDENLLNNIQKICQTEMVEKVVIGVSEQEMAIFTKQFAEKLETVINLPMEFVDETLSSYYVEKRLKEANVTGGKRQQPIDHLAAAYFLQEWLDAQ